MKKILLICMLFFLLIFSSFTVFDHNLTGHWVSYGPDNSKAFLDFNHDGTFKVSADGQIENEGNYKFSNDTFFMYDNNCGMQVGGKYKLTFYTEDSVSFAVIEDLCKDRAKEINGGIIKRLPGE